MPSRTAPRRARSAIIKKDPPVKLRHKSMISGPDLQRRWDVSYDTLHRMRRDGRGPAAYWIGRGWRYRLADVEAYEASLPRAGGVA